MAHPVIEVLYIGLVASGMQAADTVPQAALAAPRDCVQCIATLPSARVVYDWTAGNRTRYQGLVRAVNADERMVDGSRVGMTDHQMQRIAGAGTS